MTKTNMLYPALRYSINMPRTSNSDRLLSRCYRSVRGLST